MSKNSYSKHQQDVIQRYYNNIDAIMLQKLQELTTELYLAKNTSKEDRLWQRAHKAMQNIKVKPALIDHIMQKRNVEVLAQNVKNWLDQALKNK